MLIHKDREGYVGMKKEPYSRVSMALKYRIKEFVTHPNCQQVRQPPYQFIRCNLLLVYFTASKLAVVAHSQPGERLLLITI